MRKNILIIVGVIIIFLVAAGLWYSFGSNFSSQKNKKANETAVDAASASEHFKVTPLTKEFVVDDSATTNYGGEKVTLDSSEKLPVSTSFKSFTYDATKGETLKISGSCSDAYYAIIIFQGKDDYKKKPDGAVFNQATSCPEDKNFTRIIELRDYNLPTGEYYFFVADQGKSGSWYNPR